MFLAHQRPCFTIRIARALRYVSSYYNPTPFKVFFAQAPRPPKEGGGGGRRGYPRRLKRRKCIHPGGGGVLRVSASAVPTWRSGCRGRRATARPFRSGAAIRSRVDARTFVRHTRPPMACRAVPMPVHSKMTRWMSSSEEGRGARATVSMVRRPRGHIPEPSRRGTLRTRGGDGHAGRACR